MVGSTSVSLNGRVDLLADYDSVAIIKGQNGFQGTSNFYPTASGVVTFGANSLTEILPELSSTDTVVGTQLALSSLVNVEGGSIDMEADSLLLAPSANVPSNAAQPALGVDGVALTAGVTLDAGSWLKQSTGSYALTYTTGEVYLDTGATIDVSGSENVDESVADNIISAQLLGTELANSPLQQDGALRGDTIEVDIRDFGNYDGTEWVGTPIGDISGYVNLIERTVGQLTTAGGTVAINAGGSTVLQNGAAIDVSGGWINYQGATVQTSEVVSNGLVYDISQATPNQVYSGLYEGFSSTSSKYGVTETDNEPLQSGSQYEAGYLQGGNGGGISISTPELALDGTLSGTTVTGAYQTTPTSQIAALFANTTVAPTMEVILGTPLSSTLTLNIQAQNPASSVFPEFSPTPPNIVFESGSTLPSVGAFGTALPSQRISEIDLSPGLVDADGFGNLTIINSDGNITVPAGVSLMTPYNGAVQQNGTLLAGGSITFDAANIDIEGSLDAPGGNLSFTTYDFSPYIIGLTTPPPTDPTRGHFTLGASATLSTAGLVVDNRPTAPDPGGVPLLTNGGTISIASYNVDLAAGSQARDAIDVSGGVVVSAAGKLSYGNGGAITIKAGTDPGQSSIQGGGLIWNPYLTELLGYSGATGGALTITSPLVQIGGNTLLNGDTSGSGTLWLNEIDAQGNLLEPDFFDQDGFTSFTINGSGGEILDGNGNPTGQFMPGTLIAPNTIIDPVVQTRLASLDGNGVDYITEVMPSGLRAPVSLSFNDTVAKDFFGTLLSQGNFIEEAGSVIESDPQGTSTGSIAINANTVAILGSVLAPGGAISIKGAASFSSVLTNESGAAPSVDLGPQSIISAAGQVDLIPSTLGYQSGAVLPGGTITVNGNIIAEAGSILDVVGASGVLDEPASEAGLPGTNLSSSIPVATRVDSSGGTITLTGSQELFTDATLLGQSGGPSAPGGTLVLSSGIFSPTVVQTPLDPTLVITQDQATIPVASYYPAGQTAIGYPVVDANGNVLPQRGYFTATSFDSGGFGSLTLNGTVRFAGSTPVTLNASQSLSVATGGVLLADSGLTVNLIAPYVDLGMAFQAPLPVSEQTNVFDAGGGADYFTPTYGTATLNVAASLIDIGNLSLQGFGTVYLTAANGDIRGDGTFDVSGNIYLTAGQIYPTTDNFFTIADYDYLGTPDDSTITIAASGSRDLPYSAGGELNIYASNIIQGGVLRAPFGVINLGSGGVGAAPVDYITGAGVPGASAAAVIPSTVNLTLTTGSVTSVSAINADGTPMILPYGTNINGVSWIDPAGNDITVAGNGPDAIPTKSINITGTNVVDQAGSTIDIRGGGDLYSYSFVTGTSGTQDILASTGSFAVIPGYQAAYAPYYSADYANGSLAVGEQVYLNGSSGLPAGIYTLLPARYALEPGAFLITPQSSTPPGATVTNPDGSSTVAGYEFNGLNSSRTAAPLLTSFQIDPPSVVAARADYDVLSANTFLSQSAAAAGIPTPRLPADAGQLILAASRTLNIAGAVESQAGTGGAGGLVDIASSSAILISGPNTDLSNVPSSTLVLDSSDLSAFGADSLLIGGYRAAVAGGDSVTVTTNSLTVDNQGASVDVDGTTLTGLSAPDVILVSNQSLTLDAGAAVEQLSSTSAASPPTLFLTGNGALLRVSDGSSVQTLRTGVNPANTAPALSVGAGATIGGANGSNAGSITLDSTHGTNLDSTALLRADTVNINSGQISIELTPPAVAPVTSGLVLSGTALADLQNSAQTLSLLSYSSIDIYGSGEIGTPSVGGVYAVANLELHSAEIRGFSDSGGGGSVVINANDVSLDNTSGSASPGAVSSSSGSLTINAATIDLGTNQLNIDQYDNVVLNASSAIVLAAETKMTQADTTVVTGTGAIVAENNITLNTPLISAGTYSTTEAAGNETISATDGNLDVEAPSGPTPTETEGLGASLNLSGQSVTDNSVIDLPSGSVTLHATTGNVSVGGTIDLAGTAQVFNEATEYTSGGQITLTADAGSVDLLAGSLADVSANSGGGNAGTLNVNTPQGEFVLAAGTMTGVAGTGGTSGNFNLDAASISGGQLQPLDSALNSGGFLQSISIRDRTDDDVVIDGTVKAADYDLSTDEGSITVDGTINASDVASLDPNGNAILVGGTIDLQAAGSITLTSGSLLTVAAQNFSNAGQGGSVTLAAGAETNGNFTNTALNTSSASGPLLDVEAGSTINLSVAARTSGSAALGDLSGTLTLSAPQTLGNTDLQVAPINGTILNASSIIVEGNQEFEALDGSIDNQEANVMSNGTTFAGNTAAILSRIYGSNANAAAYTPLTSVEPGAEIINPNGDLTLDSTWDLSTYRFGPGVNPSVDGSGAPGILTLRAAGNVIFEFGASLSDGFDTANEDFSFSYDPLWTAPLLPVGDRSWSYQITAGADFNGANLADVQSAASLQAAHLGGSVQLGAGSPALPASQDSSRDDIIDDDAYFQTIRTGTGNITIDTSGDVDLINNVATIYTAGTQAPTLAGFTTPNLGLTAPQSPEYGAQYSLEGGNVVIAAQGNIQHETASGQPDSSLELPTTWLYRQGALNASGSFLTRTTGNREVEQTSWWVDFSNYFEGIGALGGGNVTLTAGQSIINVDASIPTNARMSGTTPNAANLVELGGGDLVVRAGDDINGGVYYIERGNGTLDAGSQILTNSTRAAVARSTPASEPVTWLPTTLFLGDGSFNVASGGDVLLGPVANPFLLPQGVNNEFANDSYFSTYASTDAINVSSLTGTVTLKDDTDGGEGTLSSFYTNIYLAPNGQSIASFSEPWLLSTETSFSPFTTVAGLMPPTLNATAFAGDIDVLGTLTLSPSATGTINLFAADSLNGFGVNAETIQNGTSVIQVWGSSTINLSDADPSKIPSDVDPLSSALAVTNSTVLNGVNSLFAESGATENLVLQTRQALHADVYDDVLGADNVLHANDPNPVQLYAQNGDISGFNLFSGKMTRVIAGDDITDIALYIQNVSASDISVVAAGGDIIPYDIDTPLRLEAATAGNTYIGASTQNLDGSGQGGPNAGDIQINGPGTLEVLAGGNLNLGIGPNNANGTGAGISSIGNTRDPYLTTFAGADVIAAAGLGSSAGFNAGTKLDFEAFETEFLTPGTDEGALYLPQLATDMGLPGGESDDVAWQMSVLQAFKQLPVDRQDVYAMDIFYLALRDAGRNHTAGTGTGYASGFDAIDALFPGSSGTYTGNITLTSREIVTTNGGNIDLLAPGGQVTVGYDIAGNQPIDQGILTEDGGNISIFAESDLNVGTSRIFTLHGGNIVIWSTNGNIAAGSSSKTVQSAPPTRVLVDPQSGSVQTDLAGLATGGGIGVLETVVGAPPSDVDLIAPNGTVDAGDAGIRVSGNLNIAAVQVLNAGNIQVGGKSAGTPTTTSANIAGLSAASNATGAATSAANETSQGRNQVAQQQEDLPSIITVEVLGYGGSSDE